jgi:O-succinylbenzoic acid--CoA ligase
MTTIRCPLSEAAQISRHEPAIVSDERVIRYHELDELASRVAGHLADQGCVAGDRVAVYLPVDWRCIAIFYGILRAGASACFIHTRLPRAAVLEQIRQLGCRHVAARLKDPAAPDLAGLQIHDPGLLLVPRDVPTGDRVWQVALDQPATIVFTSGSSGEPKAAVLSYGNHYYSARGSNLNIRLGRQSRWLLSLPLYHVGGLGILFRCLLAGATVVVPDPEASLEDTQTNYGVTHLSLVSTQLLRLLRLPLVPVSFAEVKAILLGGGPIPASAWVEALRRGWPVYGSYGLTEMASQVCTVSPLVPPAQRMNAGSVLRHRKLRINASSEIEVQGETLFMGYWTQGRLDPARSDEGWFATGDLGEMNEHGQLTVKGRRDFMFISGGENIQPEEIERVLGQLAGIGESVVVPVTDPEYGARPVAFVRFLDQAVPVETMQTHLAEHLPKYKIPIRFFDWPDQGDSSVRKPDRVQLTLEAQLRHLTST